MANIDTGLGWSADENYLLMSGPALLGQLTTITAPLYPNQPLIYADTPLDYETSPIYIQNKAGGGNVVYKTYYTSGTRDAVVFAFRLPYTDGEAFINVYFVSNTQNAIGRTALFRPNGTYASVQNTTLNAYDNTTGLYYHIRQASGFSSGIEASTLPVFNTFAEGMAAIRIATTPYYKMNPGYAVSCWASWYTTEGSHLISPILISTVESSVVLSENGVTPHPDQTTMHFLKDGVYFYMGFIGGIDAAGASVAAPIPPVVPLEQLGGMLPQKLFQAIAHPSVANIIILDSPDPYQDGEGSGEDGGDGDDPEDDPVDEETMPLPAIVGLGFSTVYVPTQADLYSLAAYLWGGNLNLDTFLKLFANPMDSILGLSAVPLVLSGTYEPIYLGGQLLQGITMPRYTGRTAVKVDMGTATISERWGAYLDYDPYTEISIYVPFVGFKNIKTDDVMNRTIRLMYDIDILSGACVAYLRPEGGSVLYEWTGQCAMQIPITGANWDNIFNTAIRTAATLGGALFAPASAPVLGGAVASAASQAIAAKPRIERSGAVNGVTGFLGQLRPYIIRTIPEALIPGEQNKFIGYPSYISVNLDQLTGYNDIASIHLENIPATGDELSELESILKGGAIF